MEFSLPGARVVAVLDRLKQSHDLPKPVVCDNSPEFAGAELDKWAYRNGITLDFIDPGKPTQNAFIESLNGTFREECLNENWFLSLADARQTTEAYALSATPDHHIASHRTAPPESMR